MTRPFDKAPCSDTSTEGVRADVSAAGAMQGWDAPTGVKSKLRVRGGRG
jgi:hypothetical protein